MLDYASLLHVSTNTYARKLGELHKVVQHGCGHARFLKPVC